LILVGTAENPYVNGIPNLLEHPHPLKPWSLEYAIVAKIICPVLSSTAYDFMREMYIWERLAILFPPSQLF
jgi:hypothetical protein